MATNVTVTMYSRTGCHLCEEARAAILAERERAPSPFGFEERLIDGDEDLEREFGMRIPVVMVDGVEEFEYHVDVARLRELLS